MTPASLIRRARASSGLTQTQLAERLGISQPEVARLESPRTNLTIATLEAALAATGNELVLGFERDRSGIDEDQIRENLKLTPAQRLDRLAQAQRNVDELTRAARFRDG